MKVSVITVVYNNVNYIEDCIKSVISQSYDDIEYIIIDGKSTDGTLDIIDRHREKIAKLVSEKDKGYTYAMNKGLRLATGDIVGFLHSDDFYAHNRVIEKVAGVFEDELADALYGDLVYIRKDTPEKVIRYWKGETYDFNKIRRGWMPPHPTLFVKKEIYRKFGYFDTSFVIAADYEIVLRFLYRYRIRTLFFPEVLVKMRWGGVSNRSIKNIIKKTKEDYRACRMHGLGISTVIMKNILKLPQFLHAAKP